MMTSQCECSYPGVMFLAVLDLKEIVRPLQVSLADTAAPPITHSSVGVSQLAGPDTGAGRSSSRPSSVVWTALDVIKYSLPLQFRSLKQDWKSKNTRKYNIADQLNRYSRNTFIQTRLRLFVYIMILSNMFGLNNWMEISFKFAHRPVIKYRPGAMRYRIFLTVYFIY